jgi:hypothetical protein
MTGFYTQRKRVGNELNSRETERERDRVWLQKGYGMGNKLDHWRKYLWQVEKDNSRSYHDEHLDYLQEFRWLYFSRGAVPYIDDLKHTNFDKHASLYRIPRLRICNVL